MPTMVLTQDCEVHGQPRRAGYVFEATDKEVPLWQGLGRARIAQEGERPRSRRANAYNRRDMRAQD